MKRNFYNLSIKRQVLILKSIILVVILLLLGFNLKACTSIGDYKPAPPYESRYSTEEHRERLTTRLNEKYKDASTVYEELIDFEVYTVYGFDEVPEYFLLEYTWKGYDNFADYPLDVERPSHIEYQHTVGIIVEDEYYTALNIYPNRSHGVSLWKHENVLERKLYFSSNRVFAYKDQDGKIYGWYLSGYSDDFIPEYSEKMEFSKRAEYFFKF